jgi:D-sedoheptulose 7-phosphate isomerase
VTIFQDYIDNQKIQLDALPLEEIEKWAEDFKSAWSDDRQFFIFGNGGSAGNAIHLANDFLYGISPNNPPAMRATALTANSSILTCLGNDVGYDAIFSEQLKTLDQSRDLVLVFSGSGNSPNVVKAIETANDLGMKSYAIVGFSEGKCKELADHCIRIEFDDMQISEDFQFIVGYMIMQWLKLSSTS